MESMEYFHREYSKGIEAENEENRITWCQEKGENFAKYELSKDFPKEEVGGNILSGEDCVLV